MPDSKQERTAHVDAQKELNATFERVKVSNDPAELRAELEKYRRISADLLSENNALQSRVALLEEQYFTVENSEFWKITKPFRRMFDSLKRISKKNRVLRKLAGGVSCLKQNGFRYTMRRVRVKLLNKLGIKTPVYDKNELDAQRKTVFEEKIKFSILVPLYNTPEKLLKEMIKSVIAQTYADWELCLADGSDEAHAYVERVVKKFADADPRIRYQRLEKNAGISENTNACAKMATGDYIGLLDHDDLLSPIALFMNAKAISLNHADVLYSDEDHLSLRGVHVYPLFKPDWSPDLLYSQMYTCHFTVVRKSLFDQIGGFRSEFDGSQDYDLMLRLSEVTDQICHIPAILYTWRECPGSTAANADAKPYAHEAGRRALDAHLKRRYGDAAKACDSDYTFVFDARFGTLQDQTPKASIIIPMKDQCGLTDACVRSILEKTTYTNYEILLLDNRSEKLETFEWFREIVKVDPRIRVLKADMEFNWAKLNNFGVANASGGIYVFLNNDTLVISPDWLERLVENTLRPDIGVVGALLLYEDMTIQHAGVVVGMNQLADHVFKGLGCTHFGSPFISPMVSRNVLAVTGACMAISREKLEHIGPFDESFIICGSDVELCVRAYEYGYHNRYDVNVRLFHLESKSRNSYIPPIDFKRSMQCYDPYLEGKDPYYNINLNLNSLVPKEEVVRLNMIRIKRVLKRIPPVAALARTLRRELMPCAEISIPEIGEINAREDKSGNTSFRLNFMTPSVDVSHVFGGISTAMNLFESLRKQLGCDGRIISTDADVIASTSTAPEGYRIVKSESDSSEPLQLVAFNDRANKTIPVRERDVFVTTAWWTAYTIYNVMEWQAKTYQKPVHPLIYIIQDYEPGFYPWSSRYMMADSTYRFATPTYAIINSKLLKEFFDHNGYSFAKSWYFEPMLNKKLAAYLPKEQKTVTKKKQILVYGRPSVDRNAFALVVETLKLWKASQPDFEEWTLYSAGEAHGDVDLGDGCYLQSLGKLSLESYANTMLDTYAGLSLMVSPHPSYPPLEMSTFGVKTVTNCYANKDLSSFNENMSCLADASPRSLADALLKICAAYDGKGSIAADNEYAKGGEPFADAVSELAACIKENFEI